MRESNLAADFHRIFAHFAPVVCVNHSVPGWPDRMLQEPGTSKVVFSELKMCKVNEQVLVHLRSDQAAWLFKWQHNGGKCFLFLGLTRQEQFQFYGVYVAPHYKDWLKIPTNYIELKQIKLFTEDKQIRYWFNEYLQLEHHVAPIRKTR